MRKNNATTNTRVNNAAKSNKSFTLATAFGTIIAAADKDWLDTDERKSVTYVTASAAAKKDGMGDFRTICAATAVAKIAAVAYGREVWNASKKRYEIPADLWKKAEKAWQKAGEPTPDFSKKKPAANRRSTTSSRSTTASRSEANPKTEAKPKTSRKAVAAKKRLDEANAALRAAENAARAAQSAYNKICPPAPLTKGNAKTKKTGTKTRRAK